MLKKAAIFAVCSALAVSLSCAEALADYSPGAAESISYLYNGTSKIYANNIDRTRGNLTVVLPDYFHIDENGDAVLTKTPDPAFIASQQAEGRRVIAYVSNHWSMDNARKMLKKRGAVAAKLAAWAVQYKLDGIDVDIENLNQYDKADFTDFMRLLRSALPPDKRLSAAVAPNPYKVTTGWQGQYDYAAIGAYCDTVLIMTYDQSYQGGPPGPVASYAFIEQSIQEALRYIPANKLLMGIPFYGRYWTAEAAKPSSGLAFTISDIDVLTGHYSSSIWYDAANQCARATMTVKSSDLPVPLWGGKTLAAGKYDIWYENEESISKKLSLVKKYGLRGVGSWALGQEPERIWVDYRSWLKGLPFDDIAGHWAEEPLTELYDAGFVKGVGNRIFNPNAKTTRAEVIVMFCKLLGIREDASGAPAEIQKHWAAGYMWAAVNCGFVSGDERGLRPDDPITRQELAAIADKALNIPNTIDYSQSFYGDVDPSMWSNGAIVAMTVQGILSGPGDGNFYPLDASTRAEAATIVWKLVNQPKKTFTPGAQSAARPLEPR